MAIQYVNNSEELLSDLHAMCEVLGCLVINDLYELNAWLRKVRLVYKTYKNPKLELCVADFSKCPIYVKEYIANFLKLEGSGQTEKQIDDELMTYFLCSTSNCLFDNLVSEIKAAIKNKNLSSGLTSAMFDWYNQKFMGMSPSTAVYFLSDAGGSADTRQGANKLAISKLLNSFNSDGSVRVIDDKGILFLCKLVIGLHLLYENFSVYQEYVRSENERRYLRDNKHRTFIDAIKGKDSEIGFLESMIMKIKSKYNICDETYGLPKSKKSVRFAMRILDYLEKRKIALEYAKTEKLSTYVSDFYEKYLDKFDCSLGKDILSYLFMRKESTRFFDMFDVTKIPSEQEKLREWEEVFSELQACYPEGITFPALGSQEFKALYDATSEYVCSLYERTKTTKGRK